MFAITRFSDVDSELLSAIQEVADHWRLMPGNDFVEVLVNVDEPGLAALVSKWEGARAYRQAFSGYDTKMLLTPVMLKAIDEPSAYLRPEEF